MRDKVFYISCFGFVFGVLLRSFIFLNFYLTVLLGMLALSLLLFFIFISKNKWGVLVSVFILVFSFGIFRFHIADKPASDVFESQVNHKVYFLGKIIDEPSIAENNQKLTVEIRTEKNKTTILTILNRDADCEDGDEINLQGQLEKPENFITDQGKVFDYVNYLRKDGIFYVIRYPEIKIVSHGNGNTIKSALFSVKETFLRKMNLVIREPESLLMGGLILGEKSSFNESLRQSFVDTGTIHIV